MPCRDEGDADFFTEWTDTFASFDEMGLHESLLRGIYAYGMPLLPPCSPRLPARPGSLLAQSRERSGQFPR